MTTERLPRLDEKLLNDVCQMLAHPLRRQLLYDLSDDGRASLHEPREYASDGGVDSAPALLHHQHLPMLEAAGFVVWNQRSGEVQSTETLERVRGLLETVRRIDTAGGR
jgi:hypothetical protein